MRILKDTYCFKWQNMHQIRSNEDPPRASQEESLVEAGGDGVRKL